MGHVDLRYMVRADMPEVCKIEEDSFGVPWSANEFRINLRERNCIGMVATIDRKVVGYMVYELHKAAIRIINIAVDEPCRLDGVGRSLVSHIVGRARQSGRFNVMSEVSEANLNAQLFFKAIGFRWIQTISDFYHASDESCYLMQHVLGVDIGGCDRDGDCAVSDRCDL
jgi:ribosomal-protein-alanine N-acetyltransferase